MKAILPLLIICFLVGSVFAQATADFPSLKKLPPKERFLSVDGGFSIALPKKASGLVQLPGDSEIKMTGILYQWVLEEAGIVVGYTDYTNPDFIVKTDQQFINYFAGVKNGFVRARDAEILTEQFPMFSGHRGYAFSFQLPDGDHGIGRAFLVGKRGYTLLAHLAEGPQAEKLVVKAFDSFELLPEKDNKPDSKRGN